MLPSHWLPFTECERTAWMELGKMKRRLGKNKKTILETNHFVGTSICLSFTRQVSVDDMPCSKPLSNISRSDSKEKIK